MLIALVTAYVSNADVEGRKDEPHTPAEPEIEELVVTGTLLTSNARSTATPMSSISVDEINSLGATDFKDIVRSLALQCKFVGNVGNQLGGRRQLDRKRQH